jgi:hypothetical protein
MKAIFGIVSLLLVLAIVGSVAKKQLQAVDAGLGKRAPEVAGAPADAGRSPGRALAAEPAPVDWVTGGSGGTVSQQSRSIQERARSDTVRALEQGAERNKRADTP